MRDPYLYDDVPILKNRLNIRKQELLDNAEADYVVYRLKDLALNPMEGKYDMRHKNWNRMNRSQLAIEFGASLARLWKIHPFREGNTRTTVTFCCQYIDEVGFDINRKLFEENSRYLRTALVAYNAYFADGSDFSQKEYLEKIVYDAFGK